MPYSHPLCEDFQTYTPIDPVTGELIDCGEYWYAAATPWNQEEQWINWLQHQDDAYQSQWSYDEFGQRVFNADLFSPAGSFFDSDDDEPWYENILTGSDMITQDHTSYETDWHEPFNHVIGFISLFAFWRLIK